MNSSHPWVVIAAIALMGSPALAQPTADVQIIHNSPDPGLFVMDIYLDGGASPWIENLNFPRATTVRPIVPDQQVTIGIAPGNSIGPGDIVRSFDKTFNVGEGYLLIAAGVLDPGSYPPNPDGRSTEFYLAEHTLRRSGTGSHVDILPFHGVPDAPTIDIVIRGSGPLVVGLAFQDFGLDYTSITGADYVLDVIETGQPGEVLGSYRANLTGVENWTAVLFGYGFAEGFPGQGRQESGLALAFTSGTVWILDEVATPVISTSWGQVKQQFR